MLTFPPMPEIGHTEIYYANLAHRAQKAYDTTARDCHKVGHYVTLGCRRLLDWPAKLRYFRHALDHHCIPPPYGKDDIQSYYRELTYLVRDHCGREALRLIRLSNDDFSRRILEGETSESVRNAADELFRQFIPSEECPDWFCPEDFAGMKMMRGKWLDGSGPPTTGF
jgi:hypothetical protein